MVKQSSCSTFIEKFQNHLISQKNDAKLYDFEQAEIRTSSVIKEKNRGCDYALIYNCDLVLIECKKGLLSLQDFERARRQLEYSVDVITQICGDSPDRAIICCERTDALVTMRKRKGIEKLKNQVPLVFSAIQEAVCRVCQ